MPTSILIKRSSTASAVPTAQDITTGELAVNTVDKRIFTNNNGTIVELGTYPSSQAVAGNATIGGTLGVTGATTLASGSVTGDFSVAGTLTVSTPSADTDAASKGYVDTVVSNVIDSAPAALDTLNELAAALNDDANFASTVTDALATKLNLSGGTMTGSITMGANKVTSTATPTAADDLTRKGYVDDLYQSTVDAEDSATAAAASATAAATSASSASTSATTATTQASAASSSASAAATSETNAGNSATSASNSASASATSATNASNSATAASDSADEAAASATAAAASAQEAEDTLSTKVSKSGDTMTGDLNFGDDDKAVFGAGSDLQIYHDGDNGYITNSGTGSLIIQDTDGNGDILIKPKSGQTAIAAYNDNTVQLSHSGDIKLSTISTGVDVTGTVTADGFSFDYGDTLSLTSGTTGTSLLSTGFVSGQGDYLYVTPAGNSSSNNILFKTANASTYANRMLLANNGDISFYDDTGSTPKLIWGASSERLTIDGDNEANSLVTAVTASVLELNGNSGGSAATWFGSHASGHQYIQVSNSSGNTAYNLSLNPYGGNVGIGTSSPASNLDVSDTGETAISITSTGVQRHQIIQKGLGDGSLTFYNQTASAERMRIDSSGNLLVGTTTTDGGYDESDGGATTAFMGASIGGAANGSAFVSRRAAPLQLNRQANDGDIAVFRKNGSTVGSIGVGDNDNLYITGGTGSTKGLIFTDDQIIAGANGYNFQDANTTLGNPSYRFKDLYLSGGVYLGGTDSAHHLDDYEEGSWGLRLWDGTTLGTGFDTGFYTKIGRLVHITCRATNVITTGLTGTVDAKIVLPFAPSDEYSYGHVYVRSAGDATLELWNRLVINPATGYATIERDTDEGVMDIEDFATNTTDIFFTATYITAS